MRTTIHRALVACAALGAGCAHQNEPNERESAPCAAPRVESASAQSESATPPIDAEPTRMFVVRKIASVCLTKEEARAGECERYSGEFKDGGALYRRGEAVSVVTERADDGVLGALMYKKAGVHGGWIAADAVAHEPDTTHVDAFVASLSSKVRVYESPSDFDFGAWRGAKRGVKAKTKRAAPPRYVYVRRLYVSEQIRGCAANGGEWVECALSFAFEPMAVARWERPEPSEDTAEWPVFHELVMSSNGLAYDHGDYVDVLMERGPGERITLHAVVDRFGVWPARGAAAKKLFSYTPTATAASPQREARPAPRGGRARQQSVW